MATAEQTHIERQARVQPTGGPGIESLVGYILLVGVLVSLALLTAGLVWDRLDTGHLGFDYTVEGMNLFHFLLSAVGQAASGAFRPRLLVNLGIAVLMLTPYVRVMASMLYFAFVEHNRKYTIFTAVVFSVLTYSLFLK
jgi:uncharacterized membrane protein